MMLSEEKTYRTRDGSRTGIRVRREHYKWTDGNFSWAEDGVYWRLFPKHGLDLIEEQPAERPFSYDACPVGEDGRRRAVTRDGREVVLLCKDGPRENLPIVGFMPSDRTNGINEWRVDGGYYSSRESGVKDLLIPPPPKRVVWVNLYERKDGLASDVHASEKLADEWGTRRLGNRAYPIEIDEALR